MSKLVFDAIGKYIHPTRYRQILQTESLNQLTSEEQRILPVDQKHSSAVAKVQYKKRRSLEVAVKARESLQSFKETRVQRWTKMYRRSLVVQLLARQCRLKLWEKASLSPPRKVVIPTENLRTHRKFHRVMKLTADKGHFLKRGINRHGYGQWTTILRDSDFNFQEERTADSLKKRTGLKCHKFNNAGNVYKVF